MQSVETLTHKGHTIEIVQDQDCSSPREYDNLGKMIYLEGSRHLLGDNGADQSFIDEVLTSKEYIALPVYAYIHGNVAVSTEPFSCRWDSGQSGAVFVTVEKALKEFSVKRITPKIRAKILAQLKIEVSEFNKWLQGDCYGFVIKDKHGNEIDSCWGHIGMEWAIEAAKEAVPDTVPGLKTFDVVKHFTYTVLHRVEAPSEEAARELVAAGKTKGIPSDEHVLQDTTVMETD